MPSFRGEPESLSAACRGDLGARGDSDPLAHLQSFLDDERVDERVKRIILKTYPDHDGAFEIWLTHTSAVATKARQLAQSQEADEVFVWEAGWLHDIGIRFTKAPGIGCHGEEPYLRHGVIGAQMCLEAGLPKHALVCERHVGTGLSADEIRRGSLPLPHRDMLCRTLEEEIVCYADQFYSKSSDEALSVEEVRRRVKRHGASQLARFETMHERFG